VAEAVMDQAVLAGIGNICRSEGLFAAGIAPQLRPASLGGPRLNRLIETLASLCWQSYRHRGRWRTQVYRKHGKPCPRCSTAIAQLRLPPSRRVIYYCPVCQTTGTANRQLSLFPDLI
jgi:formamidopyrimidine-DNA glycosylase